VIPPPGIIASGAAGVAYDPLSALPWSQAWWAENPADTFTDGVAVPTWKGAGSAPVDLTQASAGLRPIYRASVAGLNNQPALQFDGVDDIMAATGLATIAQPYTFAAIFNLTTVAPSLVVVVADATGIGGQKIGINTAQWAMSAGTGIAGGTATTGPHLATGFNSGASSTITVDGTVVVTANAGTNAAAAARYAGARGNPANWMTGYLAFWGVLARALTAPEAAALRAYSQSHYGSP
jgi:hypothetical protein